MPMRHALRSPRAPRLVAASLLCCTVAAAACSQHDQKNASVEQPGLTKRDSALVLGPGDIRITNTDSSVELALVGNHVVSRLSDRGMEKVRRETDTSAVHDSGFGGSLERLVKATVQSAIAHQVEYPLSEVRDARYENGEIKLESTRSNTLLFAHSRINGRDTMKSFRPEDAQRFVDAVNARKRSGGT